MSKKWMIASDLHGSAYYCKLLLERLEEEQACRLIFLGDLLYHGPRNDLPRDYDTKAVTKLLNGVKEKLLCVKGNCDWGSLPLTLDFTVEGVHFFVTHGHMFNVKYGLYELDCAARERGADVALFGHTHIAHDEYIDGVRLFNPGSCGFGKSFGVIEVKNGQVLSNIAHLK